MIIKSIELADYRNYDSLVLQFDRGTNILYGDNAQGKTNILEAIYELPPQNRIREARTEKSLISTRKRHISELISRKTVKKSVWICI